MVLWEKKSVDLEVIATFFVSGQLVLFFCFCFFLIVMLMATINRVV